MTRLNFKSGKTKRRRPHYQTNFLWLGCWGLTIWFSSASQIRIWSNWEKTLKFRHVKLRSPDKDIRKTIMKGRYVCAELMINGSKWEKWEKKTSRNSLHTWQLHQTSVFQPIGFLAWPLLTLANDKVSSSIFWRIVPDFLNLHASSIFPLHLMAVQESEVCFHY